MLKCCSVVKGGLRAHLVPKVAHSAIAYAIGEKQIGQRVEPDQPSDDTRLMVVRHPLERIVSAYTFFCKERLYAPFNEGMANLGYKRDMLFNEFLDHLLVHYDENVHTKKQADFTGGNHIDILIPIDKLNDAWPRIAAKYNLDSLKEVQANKSNHSGWEEYYTTEQRERAEQVFKEDIELYNLAKEKYNG